MKVCYFYDYLGGGGSEIYGLRLAEGMRKWNIETVILYNQADPAIIKRIKTPLESLINKGTFDLKAAVGLKRFFIEKQIDIVHVPYPREEVLSVIAKILGAKIKIVRTYHRMDRFVFKSWLMEKILGLWVAAYIAPSEFAANEMLKGGVSRRKLSIIPNSTIPVASLRHEKAVGFIGRIEPEKGILKIAELWPESAAKLVIAGEGNDLSKVKRLKRKNVEIMGQVSDLTKFFNKISVLILPSTNETLPLSIIEAFSCGVPVVTFDIPALSDVIDADVGARVKKNDYKNMIIVALEILDSNSWAKKSQKAKSVFEEKYDAQITDQKVVSLYNQILS